MSETKSQSCCGSMMLRPGDQKRKNVCVLRPAIECALRIAVSSIARRTSEHRAVLCWPATEFAAVPALWGDHTDLRKWPAREEDCTRVRYQDYTRSAANVPA